MTKLTALPSVPPSAAAHQAAQQKIIDNLKAKAKG